MALRNAVTPHMEDPNLSSMDSIAASILGGLKSSPTVEFEARDDKNESDWSDGYESATDDEDRVAVVKPPNMDGAPPTFDEQVEILTKATLEDVIVSQQPVSVGRKGGITMMQSVKDIPTFFVHRDALVKFCEANAIKLASCKSKYVPKGEICDIILFHLNGGDGDVATASKRAALSPLETPQLPVKKKTRRAMSVSHDSPPVMSEVAKKTRRAVSVSTDRPPVVPEAFVPTSTEDDENAPHPMNFKELIDAVNHVVTIAKNLDSSTVGGTSTRRTVLGAVESLAENAKIALETSKTQEKLLKVKLAQSTLQLFKEVGLQIQALEAKLAAQLQLGYAIPGQAHEDLQALKAYKAKLKMTLLG